MDQDLAALSVNTNDGGSAMTNEIFPLTTPNSILHNLSVVQLIERSICLGEARLASTGALSALTGEHTGRAANDKFTVRDDLTRNTVWWDNNLAMSPDHFTRLMTDFEIHAGDRDLFVQDLHAGADKNHRLSVRVFSEFAWHSLFISHLLRRPGTSDLDKFAPSSRSSICPAFAPTRPDMEQIRKPLLLKIFPGASS